MRGLNRRHPLEGWRSTQSTKPRQGRSLPPRSMSASGYWFRVQVQFPHRSASRQREQTLGGRMPKWRQKSQLRRVVGGHSPPPSCWFLSSQQSMRFLASAGQEGLHHNKLYCTIHISITFFLCSPIPKMSTYSILQMSHISHNISHISKLSGHS